MPTLPAIVMYPPPLPDINNLRGIQAHHGINNPLLYADNPLILLLSDGLQCSYGALVAHVVREWLSCNASVQAL